MKLPAPARDVVTIHVHTYIHTASESKTNMVHLFDQHETTSTTHPACDVVNIHVQTYIQPLKARQ